jgi:hypothetical protein
LPSFAIVVMERTFPAFSPVRFLAVGETLTALLPGQVQPATVTLAVAVTVAFAIGLAALLSLRATARQTTLSSAWWWAVAALVAWWTTVFVGLAGAPARLVAYLQPLQAAAALLSFCPLAAVLGAKRPQAAAWNFVVGSLYAVLALPVAEAILLNPARRVDMGDARGWFLWIMLLVGPVNYVATQYWLAALLLAAAQFVALSPYLALLERPLMPEPQLVGFCLAAAAAAAAWLGGRRRGEVAHPLDRQWRDFRDAFGLLWALRVQERVNAAAQQHRWHLELTWHGFRTLGGDGPLNETAPPAEPDLRSTFRGLLRRFVSNEWLRQREEPGTGKA